MMAYGAVDPASGAARPGTGEGVPALPPPNGSFRLYESGFRIRSTSCTNRPVPFFRLPSLRDSVVLTFRVNSLPPMAWLHGTQTRVSGMASMRPCGMTDPHLAHRRFSVFKAILGLWRLADHAKNDTPKEISMMNLCFLKI